MVTLKLLFTNIDKYLSVCTRNQQKNRRARAAARKRLTSVNSFYTAEDAGTDADAVSIAGTETADDEFYDCSDEELASGDTENGLVSFPFPDKDIFLSSSSRDCPTTR